MNRVLGATPEELSTTIDGHRAEFPQQPYTNVHTLTLAILEFERSLPGWWWSVCVCSRSRDASCGPDMSGPDADLLLLEDRSFDDGFHYDDESPTATLATSLRNVMYEAFEARTKYRLLQQEAACSPDVAFSPG